MVQRAVPTRILVPQLTATAETAGGSFSPEMLATLKIYVWVVILIFVL